MARFHPHKDGRSILFGSMTEGDDKALLSLFEGMQLLVENLLMVNIHLTDALTEAKVHRSYHTHQCSHGRGVLGFGKALVRLLHDSLRLERMS